MHTNISLGVVLSMKYGPKTLDEHIMDLAHHYARIAMTKGVESKQARRVIYHIKVWKDHRKVRNLLKGK